MALTSSKSQKELLHGTLDALILKTLARGPRHGYAIARWIEDTSGDAVLIEDGSLYPASIACRSRVGGGPNGARRSRTARQVGQETEAAAAAGRGDRDLENAAGYQGAAAS